MAYSQTLSIILLFFSLNCVAQTLPNVQAILTLPESEIDLATARLAIEEAVYPDVDTEAAILEIERIIAVVKSMPEYGDGSLARIGTVLRYLYTPGPWNNFEYYQYDLDDPLGKKNPKSRSVANYLITKRGNCISMPLLVTILGQRLGVKINLALAPHHAYARYTDDEGVTNIEATSGTLLTDEQYISAFGISQEAIKHEIYLRDLSKKESITFMLYELGKKQLLEGQFDSADDTANLMLKYYPKLVSAILLKGNIYYRLLNQKLTKIKADNLPITDAVRQQLDPLYEQNLTWYAKAEALGWREPPPDYVERYLRSIEEFKIKHR